MCQGWRVRFVEGCVEGSLLLKEWLLWFRLARWNDVHPLRSGGWELRLAGQRAKEQFGKEGSRAQFEQWAKCSE